MELRNKEHDIVMRKKRKWFAVAFTFLVLGVIMVGLYLFYQANEKPQIVPNGDIIGSNEIENGIHVRTGLKDGEGLMAVVAHCTACHSAQLIIQNRMNEERWNATIRWMQETQNLWELGDQQKVIVDYLVHNYPIYKKGRRENLHNIEWYNLSE